jgi:hypothetical protein
MTCCGQGRQALQAGSPSRRTRAQAFAEGPLRLAPRERTTFYARGVTGKRYVFDADGPSPLVDAADVPALLASGAFRVMDSPRRRDGSLTDQ